MSVLPALIHWPPSGAYVQDVGIKAHLLTPHMCWVVIKGLKWNSSQWDLIILSFGCSRSVKNPFLLMAARIEISLH